MSIRSSTVESDESFGAAGIRRGARGQGLAPEREGRKKERAIGRMKTRNGKRKRRPPRINPGGKVVDITI